MLSSFVKADEIKGVVIDSETSKPIPLVNIFVLRTKQGTSSDENGQFTINININDTIIFRSVTYHSLNIVIEDTDSLVVILHPQTHYLNEVNVVADSIPLRYKSVVFPNGDPPIIAAFVSPASYFYYKLNKKEKARRKYRNLMEYERKMAKVMKIYNKDLIKEFTGYEGQALEDCYIYCNANIELEELDTEFSIKYKLLQVLTNYYKENE